ncbi:MAG: hypothetical protein ACPG8W_10585 [Candidatus Promineifilaceae bacterium]
MSILFPNKHWAVANWVSMGVFGDCVPYLNLAPGLEPKIRFCLEAEIDTLDLRQANSGIIKELEKILARVIENNQKLQGSNFHRSDAFPVYMSKLAELENIINSKRLF